jgi:hypothetical protein
MKSSKYQRVDFVDQKGISSRPGALRFYGSSTIEMREP